MTPKLMDRLARLEGVHAAYGETTPMPPEIAGALLQAIAIGLGGYPRPPKPYPSCQTDTISDAFARALGYIDRDDMEARLQTDPDEWDGRIKAADEALTARYVTNPNGQGVGRDPAFQFFVGILDELGAAKASRAPHEPHHWPSEHPQFDRAAASIQRALGMLGITSDERIAEACGCR